MNASLRWLYHLITFCGICFSLSLSFPHLAYAENMSSPSFRIQFGNFNMTSGRKSSTSYGLTDTVGQTAPGQYGMSGSVVKGGFQYLYPFEKFSFKLSTLTIDFGSLLIGTPSTATQWMEVTAVGAGGYTVYAYEDHPLRHEDGVTIINDTPCDTSCSESVAGIWTQSSKYGFGYTMTGQDIPAAFVNNTYYKQFANRALSESPQVVMSAVGVGTKRTAQTNYKVNIGANQASGIYQTQVVFIAVPGY